MRPTTACVLLAVLAFAAGCGPRQAATRRHESPSPGTSAPAGVALPAPTSPPQTPVAEDRPAPVAAPPAAPPFPEAVPESDLAAFARLGPPGSWRARHPEEEAPISFEDYVEAEPVRADGARRTLAFLPCGDFGTEERRMLDDAAAFDGIWFDLQTRVLDPVPLTDDDVHYRVRKSFAGTDEIRQYRTGWFLDRALRPRVPKDAAVLIGVTMADLYPGPGWNYVFGEARLGQRVGVYSLVRFFPEFWGEPRTDAARRLAFLRTLKLVVHETGHTFGLEHCVTWACAMNGSNSLDETDSAPLVLCPGCLRKLAWNRGFDVAARYDRLAEFLGAHGFDAEARWNRKRAAQVRRVRGTPR